MDRDIPVYKAWCPICMAVTTHRGGKCTEHMIETCTASSTSECPVCGKVINQCECKAPPIFTGEQYAEWIRAVELLEKVSNAVFEEYVECDQARVCMAERTWKDIQEWRKGEARE